MPDRFDSFSGLLRAALGDRLASPEGQGLDLFAEDILFEFPYAFEGIPQRLEGRRAFADHLARVGSLLEFDHFELEAVHPAGDTVVVEFSCRGRGARTGTAYDQAYISVITLQDGKIVRYRDYWNPLVTLSALGGHDAAVAAMGGT